MAEIDPAAPTAPPRLRFPEDIDAVVDELRAVRLAWRAAHARNREHGAYFPSAQSLKRIVRELAVALFPLRLGPPELTAGNENAFVAATLESTLSQLSAQIGIELRYHAGRDDDDAQTLAARQTIIGRFAGGLADLRRTLDGDVEAAYAHDPAARSVDEVLISYPSLTAVIHHRIAHALHALGAPLVARLIASNAHEQTGIDIHPGASIGRHFFIDHGSGVVIGETAILGERVRLFQGVTLGGDPALAEGKGAQPRHPVLADDVVVHAHAVIVGRVTIGARSRIGGGVHLDRDVPPDSLVAAAPALVRPRER